jgi:ADP-ribose pyrophosphatase YjhB (NUDIX family)
MALWKPKIWIRAKVLGLVWRGKQLLAAEIEDSAGRIKGVRPLGGCIEFGETREAALEREFREELGCVARITGPWHTLENIYEHEGNTGHEYDFVANVELCDPQLYTKDRINYLEDDGALCSAGWFSPLNLPKGFELFPNGLLELIQAGAVTPPAEQDDR